MIEYIENNINRYYNIVDNPKWNYSTVDKRLVELVYNEYVNNLAIKQSFINYDSILLNLYKYANAKVVNFFRDCYLFNRSKLEESVIKDLMLSSARKSFETQLVVEKKHIKHTSEMWNVIIYGIKNKSNLKIISSNKEIDGVIRKADDPFWNSVMQITSNWNSNSAIVITDKKETAIPKVLVGNSNIEVNIENREFLPFNGKLNLFKEYDFIRIKYNR